MLHVFLTVWQLACNILSLCEINVNVKQIILIKTLLFLNLCMQMFFFFLKNLVKYLNI